MVPPESPGRAFLQAKAKNLRKKGGMPRERLLPILKHVSENNPSEAVKKSAVAGLFLIGEISEEAFHLACDQVN